MGCGYSCLDGDDSVLLDYPAGKRIKHGPGCFTFCCATPTKLKKITLTDTQFIKVEHMDLGPNDDQDIIEVIEGPCLYEQDDPYAKVSKVYNKVNLKNNEYIVVTNEKTGDKKSIHGPKLFTPGPYDEFDKKKSKPNLSDTQYIIITFTETGKKKVLKGPSLYDVGPYEECSNVMDMIVLNDTDYVYIVHTDTGRIDIVEGPGKVTPGPYDNVSEIHKKIVLQHDEYTKIVDSNTGIIRVEKGPATVVLKQYENKIDDINKAIEVNEHTAIYILDTGSGEYDLIQMDKGGKPFMFFPSPFEQIIEKREKIRLEEKQAMVIVDRDGQYIIMRGDTDNRSFFLPPYCNILEQEWSDDLQKNHDKIRKVSRFDLRPQYMDFEFLIRTKDNVEIFLDLNFYWQIIDIHKMINTTEDAPEDICKHAQSQILQSISLVDMKEFMESFNAIVQDAVSKDDDFYSSRGVKLLRIEITGRRCKDDETERNFQDIIKEKTDRIKNLEKEEGRNEVKKEKLKGEVDQEKIQGEIISVKRGYMRNEAAADGEAEADHIANFLCNLPDDITYEQKLQIYYDKQNTERLKLLSTSGTSLYVTPEDVDLKIMNMNYQKDDNYKKGDDVIIPIDNK